MPRKKLYTLMLHTLHFLTLMSHPETQWRDFLPPVEGEETRWASADSALVSQDISWWFLHEDMNMGVYLVWFTISLDTCPFFCKRQILVHIYIECARLQPLFWLLQNLSLKFWLHFYPHLLIYARSTWGPSRLRDLLVNLLLVLMKVAIHHTRGGSWMGRCSATVGPISNPLLSRVSEQSSSRPCRLAPWMPSKSSGLSLGFSVQCLPLDACF
ncbi:unnamed protein product [Natator depressus]